MLKYLGRPLTDWVTPPVSYDINKDGYMVASLTLVKSAYRLGETVNGSVVINSGDGRVLRVRSVLFKVKGTTPADVLGPSIRSPPDSKRTS